MDGNGRWAVRHNLPRIEGHRAGAETVRRVVEACADLNIEYLTLYAFSTENWARPRREINQLMRLLRDFLRQHVADLQKHRIRLHAIGQLERLPTSVRTELDKAMRATAANAGGTLTLALSYGSRAEITDAARSLADDVKAGKLAPGDITEQLFAERLYTADLPDPDLIVRTSSELRLSNFLLWQASYAEFWFTPTLWPDFSKEEFRQAIVDYNERKRRYGGVVRDA